MRVNLFTISFKFSHIIDDWYVINKPIVIDKYVLHLVSLINKSLFFHDDVEMNWGIRIHTSSNILPEYPVLVFKVTILY